MGRTKRFSLAKFGSDGGSLADDGFKFSDRDRDTIDALFAAFEAHDHNGGERLPDPTAAPTLATLTEGGALPGGRTYFYRVSFVDKYGLESAASDEAAIATPAPVQPPGAPVLTSLNTVGATLETGVYEYALTAETTDYETQLGTLAVITLMSDRNSVQLTMPALPDGAVSFGIWRRGPADSGYTKIGTTTASTILDDGSVPPDPCACDPENLPPQENRTNSTNTVTITAPTIPTGTKAWRIYRTTASGAYGAATLVAEVSDRNDDNTLVSFYVDEGQPLTAGQPLEVSQTLRPSAEIAGGGSGAGALRLADAGNTNVYDLFATLDGTMETRLSKVEATPLVTPMDVGLPDANGVVWRITVDNDGNVVTDSGTPEGRTFPAGGLLLPTSNGTVTFELEVDLDGTLSTVGFSHTHLELPQSQDTPSTPVQGGVMWVDENDVPRFKNRLGDENTVVQGKNVTRIVASPTEPTDPRPGDVWIQTTA